MAVITKTACPICFSAELTMMVQLDSLRVFAECRNCDRGFWSPSFDDSFRTVDLHWERQAASLDQARETHWPRLVVQGQIPADERPSPEDVAAFFALDRIPLERVQWWAAHWLVRGGDGDRLAELAGEHGDDPDKIKELLPFALEEMGIAVPADPVACGEPGRSPTSHRAWARVVSNTCMN